MSPFVAYVPYKAPAASQRLPIQHVFPALTTTADPSSRDYEGLDFGSNILYYFGPDDQIYRQPSQSGVPIPQRPYRPPKSFRGPFEIIKFVSHGRLGISVSEVLERSFTFLDGRDDSMFINCGSSISLRFEWPGYPSWFCQMKTLDWKKDPSPITRSRLATFIAKALERFISQAVKAHIHTDSPWRIGPGFIQARDSVLLGITRVSKASFQPHFSLA